MTLSKYQSTLPQLGGEFFMTDGGIETTLISLDGRELPHFAAFYLLKTQEGEQALRTYFRTYGELARRFNTGPILETATWRRIQTGARSLGMAPPLLQNATDRQSVCSKTSETSMKPTGRWWSSAGASDREGMDTCPIPPCQNAKPRSTIECSSRRSRRLPLIL